MEDENITIKKSVLDLLRSLLSSWMEYIDPNWPSPFYITLKYEDDIIIQNKLKKIFNAGECE